MAVEPNDQLRDLFGESGLEAFRKLGDLRRWIDELRSGGGARTLDAGGWRIPEHGTPLEDYLRGELAAAVAGTVLVDAPRFIGHMTSALPRFMAELGRLNIALNQNQVKVETCAAFTDLERDALAMLHRLVFGRDQSFYELHARRITSTLGIVCSGGTGANLLALWMARSSCFPRSQGFDGIEYEGLAAALAHSGHRRAVVVGSSLMHYSFQKAADILGLGERGVVAVAAGRDNRVDPADVEAELSRARDRGDRVLAVVGIAGTTETGSVDPLEELADVAARAGLHYHVDAAWGGPTLFSRKHRSLLRGIERADSVTIDGHKQLYLPLGIGMLLLRDPELAAVIEREAHYTIRAGSGDLGRRALEGSRPAMSLYLHAGLKVIGKRGYETLIDQGIRRCRELGERVRQRPEFELLAEPMLNILVFRYVPERHRAALAAGRLDGAVNAEINDLNVWLQKAQRRERMGFVSRTVLATTRYGSEPAIVALRAVLANPLTTEADLDAVLDEQVELARRLEGDPSAAAL